MTNALKQSVRHLSRLKQYHSLLDPASPEAKETRMEIAETEEVVQHQLHGHTNVSLSRYTYATR